MVNPLIMDPWEAVSLRQCRWGEGKVGKGKTILGMNLTRSFSGGGGGAVDVGNWKRVVVDFLEYVCCRHPSRIL